MYDAFVAALNAHSKEVLQETEEPGVVFPIVKHGTFGNRQVCSRNK